MYECGGDGNSGNCGGSCSEKLINCRWVSIFPRFDFGYFLSSCMRVYTYGSSSFTGFGLWIEKSKKKESFSQASAVRHLTGSLLSAEGLRFAIVCNAAYCYF